MIDFLFSLGYLGLFIISFLAASLLPLSSELFVLGCRSRLQSLVVALVATIGNYCGTLVNYYVGKRGTDFVLGRYFQIKPETWARAERFYERWGPVALFFPGFLLLAIP